MYPLLVVHRENEENEKGAFLKCLMIFRLLPLHILKHNNMHIMFIISIVFLAV